MPKEGSKGLGKKEGSTAGDGLALRELLRVPGGKPMDLAAHDSREMPAGPRDRQAGLAAMTDLATPLADLQERLWAASTAGDRRRVLLVLQGMDTSGKGGTVKHVIGLFNPSGCRVHAFKAPTPRELRHHFLRRIKTALPQAGELGILDRSLPHARLRSRGGTPSRTSSSPGSAPSPRPPRSSAATTRSTASRRPSPATASP
ncbi:hypothetical protein M2158_007685 [Streptomyces sp. SAI-144]|nr:hypothetical protein [Streptomyces sp. SAI-144]